ncbi:hypothetical protein N658DRAFT_557166 [Parathielavia hyrcaniae]|uniref:DUF1279 domain-containing protein n=1 Tax=Parathielavia hyrcaniae TaxID=113614 RepID=A0AAN6Q7B8_9PEZI|nr:hypothetical protein N658DRAFT_557166 [Parathielavia hyrcaniae]
MMRTAFAAFDAALGVRGNIARDTFSRGLWVGKVSARAPAVPWHQRALMSQLRASRITATRSQFGRARIPPFKSRRPFHATRPRRADTAPKDGAPKDGSAAGEQPLSLSGRLRKLSREYGWTAAGVYLALSVLDFPFCFLLVRTVGTEKIAHLEYVVVSNVQKVIPEQIQTWWHEYRHAAKEAKRQRTGEAEDLEIIGHGVAEADHRNKQDGASLATQLALAYAIHKSFIFIRVPLTAAITPKIVRVLRSWGWQIGKKPVKSAKRSCTDYWIFIQFRRFQVADYPSIFSPRISVESLVLSRDILLQISRWMACAKPFTLHSIPPRPLACMDE